MRQWYIRIKARFSLVSEIGDDPIWKFALLMERGMLLSRNNWSVESAAWRRALARYRLACVPGKDDDLKTHLGNSVRYETIDSCLGVLSPPPEYLRPRSISSPWNRNFYRRHCLSHPTFFSMEFHPKPFRLLVIITNPLSLSLARSNRRGKKRIRINNRISYCYVT